MTPSFQDLIRLDLRPLAAWLRSESKAANLDQQESYGLVETLTSRLVDGAADIAPEEWGGFAEALEAAMGSASLDRTERAIRRLNLMSALIAAVGPSSEHSLRDPNAAAALFFDALPIEFDRASALVANWRRESRESIRHLRAVKNLLNPLVRIEDLISDPADKEALQNWMTLFAQLP